MQVSIVIIKCIFTTLLYESLPSCLNIFIFCQSLLWKYTSKLRVSKSPSTKENALKKMKTFKNSKISRCSPSEKRMKTEDSCTAGYKMPGATYFQKHASTREMKTLHPNNRAFENFYTWRRFYSQVWKTEFWSCNFNATCGDIGDKLLRNLYKF